MKFILMMFKPYGTGDHDIGTWSPEDRKAHGMFMYMMDRELVESGERIAGEGLAPPAQTKIVRAGRMARRRSPTVLSRNPRSSSPASGS